MKKILFLFVVMLGTLGAYAQSNTTPIKGDVNEDGVVDVADFVAIIEIMMNGGGENGAKDGYYYWYIGATNPTTMTAITPIVSDNSSPGWRLIGSSLPSYTASNRLWDGATNNISFGGRTEYYLALPSNTLQLYNSGGDNEMEGYTSLGTKVINGITYYIQKCTSKAAAFGFNIYSTSSDYYWYVGTTMPTNPLSAEENTGLNEWTHLGTTLPTSDIEVAKVDETYAFHTWYIAAPTDADFVLYNATNAASDEVGWDKSIININGVSYTLWTSRVTSFQAAEYLHYEGNTKYYWYIGLKKPTTSTNPILDLARFSNDSSWHKIWDELDAYNATNMLYNGSSASIYLNWEDTTFYLALPVGIGIHDDKGNNVTSEYTLESSDITIAGEKYNVYSGFASPFTHSLY